MKDPCIIFNSVRFETKDRSCEITPTFNQNFSIPTTNNVIVFPALPKQHTGVFPEKHRSAPGPSPPSAEHCPWLTRWPSTEKWRIMKCWGNIRAAYWLHQRSPGFPQATLRWIEEHLFCPMERQATLTITDQCPEHTVKCGLT